MRRHSAEKKKKKTLIRSTVAMPQVLEQGLNPDHPSEVFTGVTGHGGLFSRMKLGGSCSPAKRAQYHSFLGESRVSPEEM